MAGLGSCWVGENQLDPRGPSEHILIVHKEAEALFSDTITQALEGPVGPPPQGLVSDTLENEPPRLHGSL